MRLIAQLSAYFAGAALAAALLAGAATAQDKPIRLAQTNSLELGQLACQVVPGTRRNLILASNSLVDCVFEPTSGPPTYYQGETGIGIGLDLSFKTDDRFTFLVLTARPSAPDYSSYPLAGRYYGAEATVSVGTGVGAKALVGGSGKQFTLAPIGGQITSGGGVSAGAGYLYLEPAR